MVFSHLNIAGIDYGSKLAGTTVIAFVNERNELDFAGSRKQADADQFILEWVGIHQPQAVFLDAPLSLPGIYKNSQEYNDYFYRAADRALQAMSPMFLGGLTARAMKLQAALQQMNVITIEVYPSYLAKILQLNKTSYKKEKAYLTSLFTQLYSHFSTYISLSPPATTDFQHLSWHHFDALLALFSGMRYLNQQHLIFGDTNEGLIII